MFGQNISRRTIHRRAPASDQGGWTAEDDLESIPLREGDCGQGICFTLKTGSSLIYKRTGLIIGLKVL